MITIFLYCYFLYALPRDMQLYFIEVMLSRGHSMPHNQLKRTQLPKNMNDEVVTEVRMLLYDNNEMLCIQSLPLEQSFQGINQFQTQIMPMGSILNHSG